MLGYPHVPPCRGMLMSRLCVGDQERREVKQESPQLIAGAQRMQGSEIAKALHPRHLVRSDLLQLLDLGWQRESCTMRTMELMRRLT